MGSKLSMKKVVLYDCVMDELPEKLEELLSLFGELVAKAREAGYDAIVEVESSDYQYGYGTMTIAYERPYTQEEIEEEEAQLAAWKVERESRVIIDERRELERLKAKYGG